MRPPPFTAGVAEIEAHGQTLGEVLADVEARHPGFRVRIIDEQDRIRPHIPADASAPSH